MGTQLTTMCTLQLAILTTHSALTSIFCSLRTSIG